MSSALQHLLLAAQSTVTTTTQNSTVTTTISHTASATVDCRIFSNDTYLGNCPYYFDKVIGPLNLWLYGMVGAFSILMCVLIIYVWRLGYWRRFWGWSGMMVLGRFHDGSAVLMKAIRYGNFLWCWDKLHTGYIYSARNTVANVVGGPQIVDADLRSGIAGTPKAAAYANAISGKQGRQMLKNFPGRQNPLLDAKKPIHIKNITTALLQYWEDKMLAIPDYRTYVKPDEMKPESTITMITNDGHQQLVQWQKLTETQKSQYRQQYTTLSKEGRELANYKDAQLARIQEVRTKLPGDIQTIDAEGKTVDTPLSPLEDADVMDFLYSIAESLRGEPVSVWPAEILGYSWDARDLADWFLSTYHPSDQVKFEAEVERRVTNRGNKNERMLAYLGLIVVMSCVGVAILYIVIHG